jgi:hypothetical protein
VSNPISYLISNSDRARREMMSKKGQQLIDGKGAMRVVSEMVNMLA